MFVASRVFTPSVFIILLNIITNEDLFLFLIRFAWPVSVLTLWNAAHLKLCNSLKTVHRPISIQSSSLLTVLGLLVSRESEALSEERDAAETHESEWISIGASAQWAQTEQRLVFSSRHTSVRQHVMHWDRASKTLMKEGHRDSVQNWILTICLLHTSHYTDYWFKQNNISFKKHISYTVLI